MNPDFSASIASQPLYARFSRRVRGMVLDWIIVMALIFGALMVAISIESDSFSRVLGVVVIGALVLYEPLMVSLAGGTLGHYFSNLRVVDARGGGNLGFLKACARAMIKALLGWYSFVIIAATRRNQAVHDLLTASTVQIRDPAKANPGHYLTERRALARADMPSRLRRVLVTCLYLTAALAGYLVTSAALLAAGVPSRDCIERNYCLAGDTIGILAAAVALLLVAAFIITLGWQGRLFGARRA